MTTTRLRWVINYNACGPSPICEDRNIEGDDEWGVLKTTAIQWTGWQEDKHKALPEEYWGTKNLEVRPGDVLVTKAGPRHRVGVSAYVDKTRPRLVVSGKMILLRVDESALDPRYLNWQLSTPKPQAYLNACKTGMAEAQMNFANDDLLAMAIQLPSLDEQRRIADFLDAETARIDAISASRRTQATALDELELARISEHLSTVKQSGPVYAYFDVQLGKMLNAERATGGNQQAYLRNANVHWFDINTDDLATMTFEPDERLRYSVNAGDLLVCEGGAGVAEAAVWDGRISTCFYQKSLHRVRARSHVPVEWLMYWLRYSKAIGVFDAEGNLATIPHLTGEQLAEHRIPIPEDGHQRVAELASDISNIRETQRKMSAANALLAERRQALITAAVTGQIDVTTAGGGTA